MAKFCDICGKKLGFLGGFALADGNVCTNCASELVIKEGNGGNGQAIMDLRFVSVEKFKQRKNSEAKLVNYMEIFHPTKSIYGFLEIDETNKLWGVPILVGFTKKETKKAYSFDEILNYSINENVEMVTKSKGTLGRSVMGGLLFGGVGAVIGGTTGKKVSNEKVKSITIQINLKSSYSPISIVVPNVEFKNSIVSAIENIINQKTHNTPAKAESSGADELRKYKELLDDGIITDEEFKAKKKQLLGL